MSPRAAAALCAEPKPRKDGFTLAHGKRGAALGDGEEWRCGLKGHFTEMRQVRPMLCPGFLTRRTRRPQRFLGEDWLYFC